MSINELSFSAPFFRSRLVKQESVVEIKQKTIVLNLAIQPLQIERQLLNTYQSVIALNTQLKQVDLAILVDGFPDFPFEPPVLEQIKREWPLAYEVRKEPRLKGKGHYMSPKSVVDNIQFSMYHTATVPLKIGLHRQHLHLGGEEPEEIHTQIVGFGKMQQCKENTLDSLYLEETMAPGHTHRPMFDKALRYPWHQYETLTPGVIMAVEILKSGQGFIAEHQI